jgi:hypothetical protein
MKGLSRHQGVFSIGKSTDFEDNYSAARNVADPEPLHLEKPDPHQSPRTLTTAACELKNGAVEGLHASVSQIWITLIRGRICIKVKGRISHHLSEKANPDPHHSDVDSQNRQNGFNSTESQSLQCNTSFTSLTRQQGSNCVQPTVQKEFNYAHLQCNTLPIPQNLQCSTAPTSQSKHCNMAPNPRI